MTANGCNLALATQTSGHLGERVCNLNRISSIKWIYYVKTNQQIPIQVYLCHSQTYTQFHVSLPKRKSLTSLTRTQRMAHLLQHCIAKFQFGSKQAIYSFQIILTNMLDRESIGHKCKSYNTLKTNQISTS